MKAVHVEKIIDTLIGVCVVGIVTMAVSLYIDVDRLKASEQNIKDDITTIKGDVRDIRTYLMGEKK